MTNALVFPVPTPSKLGIGPDDCLSSPFLKRSRVHINMRRFLFTNALELAMRSFKEVHAECKQGGRIVIPAVTNAEGEG